MPRRDSPETDHKPRTIPAAKAKALLKRCGKSLPKELASLIDEDEVLLYERTTNVRGDFEVGPQNVIVQGDLTIDGHLKDGVDADWTLLVVLGNLKVCNVVTLAEIAVTGSVEAEVVYGNSLGNDRFSVAKDVTASAVICDGHWFHVGGKLSAGVQIAADSGDSLKTPDYDGSMLEDVLVGTVHDGESIDLSAMTKALLAGKNVIRKNHVPPAQRARQAVEKARRTPNLARLSLSEKNLRMFPPGLEQLTALRKLTLASNDIPSIPEQIAELTALEELDLSYNHLQTLPRGIGKLRNLRTLNLHLNCVSSLPDTFAELQALEKLDLGMNTSLQTEELGAAPLEVLPAPITELANLRVLNLSANEFKSLPDDLKQLTKLEELDLSSNMLAKFPMALLELPRLRVLNLGNQCRGPVPGPSRKSGKAHVKKAPTGWQKVCAISTLEELSLDRLDLDALPAQIGVLSKLRKLDLSFNEKLTELPDSFFKLKALRELDLSHVKLSKKTHAALGKHLPDCKMLGGHG